MNKHSINLSCSLVKEEIQLLEKELAKTEFLINKKEKEGTDKESLERSKSYKRRIKSELKAYNIKLKTLQEMERNCER